MVGHRHRGTLWRRHGARTSHRCRRREAEALAPEVREQVLGHDRWHRRSRRRCPWASGRNRRSPRGRPRASTGGRSCRSHAGSRSRRCRSLRPRRVACSSRPAGRDRGAGRRPAAARRVVSSPRSSDARRQLYDIGSPGTPSRDMRRAVAAGFESQGQVQSSVFRGMLGRPERLNRHTLVVVL